MVTKTAKPATKGTKPESEGRRGLRKEAFRLIILLGVISLLGDIIYEGARGVNGQYLNVLGVNAATVGFIVGLGELLGYVVRLISGFFADKTGSYWVFTFVGYGLLMAVPLMSLTGTWQVIAFLIVFERIGKGIRSPARDTIASHAAKQVGTGYGFGIAECLDQIGAFIGPLIFALMFVGLAAGQNAVGTYQRGYNLFWIPFILLVLALFFTYARFKKPEELEDHQEKTADKKLSRSFWFYAVFVFVTTAGFVSFALVGFHLKKTGVMGDASIALLYAVAMAVDAVIGLAAGKMYDQLNRKPGHENAGLFVLLAIPILAALVPILIFSTTLALVIVGAILFGFTVGMQETVMKAAVADMTPVRKRSTGYGIFNISFGVAFFIGSSLAGLLYDYSIPLLIMSLVAIELASVPVFYKMMRTSRSHS